MLFRSIKSACFILLYHCGVVKEGVEQVVGTRAQTHQNTHRVSLVSSVHSLGCACQTHIQHQIVAITAGKTCIHKAAGHTGIGGDKTGKAPLTTEYILQIRVSMAKQLLVKTDFSIGEIASRVGIDDVAYFSSIFRKATGKTPTAYRNR